MTWIAESLDHLSAQTSWGYQSAGTSATEVAALTALALLGHGRAEAARRPVDWLVGIQAADGSLGINADEPAPCWPTPLAALAWSAFEQSTSAENRYRSRIVQAIGWLLTAQGLPLERTTAMGHDSTLVGWPWVLGTHSWIEPTAWAVLALEATGHGRHPRTEEGIRLLCDRLLPTGGCNYGNTFVLGQQLRPHLEPTGVALLALVGQSDPAGRIDASCNYLLRSLSAKTPSISLSCGLSGLAAHERLPAHAGDWLEAAYGRTVAAGASAWKLALLALAALGDRSSLVTLPAKGRQTK